MTWPIIWGKIGQMKLANSKKQLTTNNQQGTNHKNKFVSCILYLGIFISCILFFGTWNLQDAFASACDPIYGGGLTCSDNSLSIQKQVLNPKTNKFVHNLSEPLFKANDIITFQVIIKNNGRDMLKNIVVKDNFPSLINFTDGLGTFDKKEKILTFEVDSLNPGALKLFTINSMVVGKNLRNISCANNHISALANSGVVVEDSSRFCIKTGKGLTYTPATGSDTWWLLPLLPLAIFNILYYNSRNKSRRI